MLIGELGCHLEVTMATVIRTTGLLNVDLITEQTDESISCLKRISGWSLMQKEGPVILSTNESSQNLCLVFMLGSDGL